MGPPDNSSSVVDTRARVYNTLGLRVCDASILPTKPDANTQATIYSTENYGTSNPRISDTIVNVYFLKWDYWKSQDTHRKTPK